MGARPEVEIDHGCIDPSLPFFLSSPIRLRTAWTTTYNGNLQQDIPTPYENNNPRLGNTFFLFEATGPLSFGSFGNDISFFIDPIFTPKLDLTLFAILCFYYPLFFLFLFFSYSTHRQSIRLSFFSSYLSTYILSLFACLLVLYS